MSEAAKPVEEPVAAPEAPVEAATAETAAPAEPTEAATEPAAAAEPAAAEETPAAAPVKEEAKPVEEGTLGYKGPGLLKSFIFQKKFFWFGSEPVEHKSLGSYLRGEKQQELANKNAAWSSHTGKGLLFFAKKHTEKAAPAGIINLSEVSDLNPDGTVEFSFIHGGHKHIFQTNTLIERDNWLSTLKTKVEEAKELVSSVLESETYKKSHSELTKPVVAAVAPLPKKSVEVKEDKKEEKAEAKEEKKEEKKEIKEEKKDARKSRSASRKRNSIFGNFGLGKKEEKAEVAKEEAAPAAPASEEPVAPTEAVPAETAPATEAAPAVEAPAAAAAEPKPAPTKRNSIFGNIKSQFANKDKKSEAPVVPPKDAEPVSETAPVIPAPEATEPLATEVAPVVPAPESTETPATNGETKAAETPAVKSDKRKSSLPWLTKKEKPATSDEEAEKPKSPFAKLRATVKGRSAPKTEKKEEEKPAETESTPAPTEEPVVSEPTPVVQQTPTPVAASA